MTKNELLEKIEDLKENLENYQSTVKLDQCIELMDKALNIVEEIQEYEYKTTYAKMACHIANMILCNQIGEIDEDFSFMPDKQSDEGEPIGEVMQYYLTDCTSDDVDYLCENYDRVYFSYSTKLDLWVLMVDHWGSSWDIVTIGTHNEYDKI